MYSLDSSIPRATVTSSDAGAPSAIRRRPSGMEPASTMMMSIPPSLLRPPATTSSNTESSISSYVGKGIHSPSLSARRTPATGPSKGIELTIRAADAPLRAMMSNGFSSSTESVVITTWVSQRYPSLKEGRRGRSTRRQARIPCSLGRPSLRKNDPGMRPAAYIRSSKSTVSGKKSIPSRTHLLAVAVTSISVSPKRATTAPSACPASLPVENDSVLPPTSPDTVISDTVSPLFGERPLPVITFRRSKGHN